jgi:RNA binding exosome subunit
VAGAVPFHYVDVRAFCYATEDERRVEDALRTLLPGDHPIDRTESEGHHGDRILVLSARVENADDVRVVLDALSDLPDFRRLSEQLDERIDENCAFYVYLDKQAAYEGRVERGEGITVRAKVEAYPAKKEKAVANAREALGEATE